MNFIHILSEIEDFDSLKYGGKANTLAKLIKKFNIPDGFVVDSTLFKTFLDSNNNKEYIAEELKRLNLSNIKEISKNIFSHISSFEFSPTQIFYINNTLKRFKSIYFAVRSSGSIEDGLNNAWAGQFESYLNVPVESIAEKIKEIFLSSYSERSLTYSLLKRINLTEIKMCVLIQEMIESDKSGVMFSTNPITKSDLEIVIEACYGLGESIVQGRITPDNYILDKLTGNVVSKKITNNKTGIFLDSIGKNVLKETTLNTKEVLSLEELCKLYTLAIDAEKFLNYSPDIEWAFFNNNLYLIQARPITNL